jgi:hypothetical protein
MGWIIVAGLLIVAIMVIPPWISFAVDQKRNCLLQGIARDYGLTLQLSGPKLLTVLGPDQIIEVRKISGRLNGKHVEVIDWVEVGWTFNLWGLRHFFYLFPLHSNFTRLVVNGEERDISRPIAAFYSFAKPMAIRARLNMLVE